MGKYNRFLKNNDTSQDRLNEDLVSIIARWIDKNERLDTEIPGLSFHRYDQPTEPLSVMYEPSVCLTVQGSKRVSLGEDVYVYDPNHLLITSIDLPTVAQVVEADKDRPFLAIVLKLDLKAVSQIMVDSNLPLPKLKKADRGMALDKVTMPLLDSFHRLTHLLDTPEDIPILSPLIKSEILYRLLVGNQGQRLRQIAMTGCHSHQIARSINWLKDNYTEPLRIKDLANLFGMSTSTFHHHFRVLTAMSPLQYQKWLRLHEARRLMLTDNMDAANAAFEVGYESPSQFSREYSRLFGAPPLRDIKKMAKLAAIS
jgi:AraC-like DNA-binding protein